MREEEERKGWRKEMKEGAEDEGEWDG